MPKLVSEVVLTTGKLPDAPPPLQPEPVPFTAQPPSPPPQLTPRLPQSVTPVAPSAPAKSDFAAPLTPPNPLDVAMPAPASAKEAAISIPPATSPQVAPTPPLENRGRGFAGNVGTELEDEALAAEVAAILSPESAKKLPHPSTIPRAKVVRTASERWLLDACEQINVLPEEQRPREFQKVLALYKQMQIEERAGKQR